MIIPAGTNPGKIFPATPKDKHMSEHDYYTAGAAQNQTHLSCFTKRFIITVFAVFLGLILTVTYAVSLPEFAYMENLRCIQCHVNSQGGGLRNFRGWNYLRETSLVPPEKVGLDGLYNLNSTSNSIFSQRLMLGFDERYQMAKSHRSEDADREFFNMQTEVYAALKLMDFLHIEGSYNAAETKFDGQSEWTGSVVFQPEYSFRQIRAGRFRPATGLRYDDHTMMVNNVPGAYGPPILPPGYAEYGIQYTENSPDWLSLTLGVFDAANLAESFVTNPDGNLQPLIDDEHNLSWLARAEYRPDWGGDTWRVVPGVSYFINDDFDMMNLFAGAGIGKRLSLIADYSRSGKDGMRTTHNIMLEAGYRLLPPVMLILRGERGRTYTEVSGGNEIETYTNQGLFGAQIFILPSIELRPEYRIVDTERFRSTRWALSLHVFR